MALRVVEYYASSRLSCSSCTPADVILCIDKDLVKAHAICSEDSLAPYEFRYITAKLINHLKLQDSCKGIIYKYTFAYENEQLVTPDEDLTCENVNGVFCKGCMSSWIEDQVGDEISVSTDAETGLATVTTQHGCEYVIDPLVALTVVGSEEECLGVGPDNMVRSIDLTGTTITISSAPEHTSVIGGANFGGEVGVTAVVVGQYLETRGSLVINNPSECREAVLMCWAIAPMGWNQGMGDRVLFDLVQNFDSAPALSDITSGIYETWFTGADATFRAQLRHEFYRNITTSIPAGGTVTLHQLFTCNLPELTSAQVDFYGTLMAANYHLTTV